MSHALTIRLTPALDRWLSRLSAQTGLPKGKLVRDQLERMRAATTKRSFLWLAGSIEASPTLSGRRGFARK